MTHDVFEQVFKAIEKRAEVGLKLIHPLDPYVTAGGGIVLLYGPYPEEKAEAIGDYYRQLGGDMPALLDMVKALRRERAEQQDRIQALLDLLEEALEPVEADELARAESWPKDVQSGEMVLDVGDRIRKVLAEAGRPGYSARREGENG